MKHQQMFSTPLLRWGALLSVAAAVALALALRLQQQQQQQEHQLPLASDLLQSAARTYCYKSVRTQDADRPAARCFSVRDGRFTRVSVSEDSDDDSNNNDDDGDDHDLPPPPSDTDVAHDGHVIPGLWDGHGHLLQYGQLLHSVDLFGSRSLDDARDRIAAYRAANPGAGTASSWIRGVGWDQAAFGRMPTAQDLEADDRLRGAFVMLDRVDVHCVWVSQAVLDLLADPVPDVPGGEVVRDPGMGVFCDNAMDRLVALWPPPSPAANVAAVKTALRRLNEVGLVGVHDASSTPADHRMYAAMAAAGDGDWTLRLYAMLECERRNSFCLDDAVRVERDDAMFMVRSVKLFADGALGSWGSAMLEPYSDHPWSSGSLLINASDLTAVTKAWAAAGYQVNIHAIGDLANRNAIDAFEAALRQQCPDAEADAEAEADDDTRYYAALARCQARHRFRIEHAQIIHPRDQKRMHALAIIPSVQPTHATSDMKYALARLGHLRADTEAYRMRSLRRGAGGGDTGLVLGSDFPVEPPNPFHGIYAAVTRKSPATGRGLDDSHEGWHADEALTLDEALAGFTTGPAYGGFLEGRAGIIREGAFADWVVLDEPLDDLDVEKLRTLKVRETWVAGKRVYARHD
ncbi:amidohydrolase 3 [Purpureocillium lavendulum]|uniref:Amidohydrolase 3 n=1 Tax=Purpureocillium lavendulum TaxID=1247861 RepID=A0AB34FPX6_9HYPO|nr:amidohydrolase 3 [Purpureocillium lavendulum]